jgi:hypothetical protein
MLRSFLLLLVLAVPCHAGPLGLFKKPSRSTRSAQSGSNLSAYESASISAQVGVAAHRGGVYAFEGVGFSTVSADQAIRNCCYYGQRAIVESAVVRGSRGWFACVRYR